MSNPASASPLVYSDNVAQHRFEAHRDGQLAGFAEYNVHPDALMFTHTEVLPAFEGQGVGSGLARHVLDEARARGKFVIPVCQFIAGYIRKHPDDLDLVKPETRAAFKL
jgi:predicted GNAT family acetyltransferase